MKVVATNRRAKFDYEIKEKLLTGIILTGAEVKSTKLGQISIKGSYVTVQQGELYLLNAHISPYKQAGDRDFAPTRTRKLLVHKRQLDHLTSLKQTGLALFPLAVGIERGLVKVEVGIGRGRKTIDKRETIKKRQAEREIARTLSAKGR